MSKTVLNSANAPAAIGPYSQAISGTGSITFVSGQLPIDPATGAFAGDTIQVQTKQSLENIKAILEAGGPRNEVYAQYFTADCPARAAFQVAALPKNALVEIEAVAIH